MHHRSPSSRIARLVGWLAVVVLGAVLITECGHRDPVRILVYDGYATPGQFRVIGRVLQDDPVEAPDAERSWTGNLFDMVAVLDSDEVPEARLRVEVGGVPYETTSNDEGGFDLVSPVRGHPLVPGVGQVRVSVTGPHRVTGNPSTGLLHIIPNLPCVAVISDFDDTVVKSYVTEPHRLVTQTALRNASQLEPVEGVGAAYRAARDAGACGFFYVSGSPENLYPRIRSFLELHRIPTGPILLKNFGSDAIFAQDEYKIGRIERLLSDLPGVRFVLVGDSGERDPEIYRTLRDAHHDRIRSVVIRAVPGSDINPDRMGDLHVVSDYAADEQVIAAMVR